MDKTHKLFSIRTDIVKHMKENVLIENESEAIQELYAEKYMSVEYYEDKLKKNEEEHDMLMNRLHDAKVFRYRECLPLPLIEWFLDVNKGLGYFNKNITLKYIVMHFNEYIDEKYPEYKNYKADARTIKIWHDRLEMDANKWIKIATEKAEFEAGENGK